MSGAGSWPEGGDGCAGPVNGPPRRCGEHGPRWPRTSSSRRRCPSRYGFGRVGARSLGGCAGSPPRRQNPPVCASVLVYVRWGRTAHTPTLVLGAAGRDLLRFVGQLLCVGSSERATVTRHVCSSCVVLTGRTSPCYWYFMEAPNFLSQHFAIRECRVVADWQRLEGRELE